ncbi:MAG: hypothetical protein A2Y24_04390 [Clostridiales bacterium GWE2_32_10]|nr:MAG: hypothetical protein A2Y24_04390 [Clostridiales bacterium GWE2_32_10]HBY21330.1 hypothetical protein [Clostridiales bacterium]
MNAITLKGEKVYIKQPEVNEFGGEIMQDGVAINNKIGQRALLNFGFKHTETTEEAFVVEMSKEKFSEMYN